MKLRAYIILTILGCLSAKAPAAAQPAGGTVEIHQYFADLARREPTENHKQLAELTDKSIVQKKMNVDRMSDFMKSTRWQTKMVYAYSKATTKLNGEKVMTPYDMVHSLADDLFQRKALQKFVSKRQKDGLLLRRDIIDWAVEGRRFTEDFLTNLTAEYDRNTFKQEEDDREIE